MMESVRVLVTSLIDYAGLFPPAALSVDDAAARYDKHLVSTFGWMLGRFVVPASRLGDLAEAARSQNLRGEGWRLSALAGPDLEADVARVLAFNNRQPREENDWPALVDAIETMLESATVVNRAVSMVPGGIALYGEVPASGSARDVIAALADKGARAKLRTGGASASLFPSSADLVGFIAECSSLAVPFKLTAGLHHLLPGRYPPAREAGGEDVWMHGFLNVFLAAAFLDAGMDADTAVELLDDTSPGAFRFEDDRLAWRDYWVSTKTLAETRQEFALSFGSCSFSEPLGELRAAGILED